MGLPLRRLDPQSTGSLPRSPRSPLILDCWGTRWKVLDHRGLPVLLEHRPIKSPQKLGKLIGYFEKAPGPSQTQANKIPGEQRFSLSLSLSPLLFPCSLSLPVCLSGSLSDAWWPTLALFVCALSHLGACSHVGLAASRDHSRRRRLQRTKLWYEPETLDTVLCFVLAEDKVELFPWRNKGVIRNPWASFYFHPNNPCHRTISHAWVLGMLSSWSHGRASFPTTTILFL